MTAYPRAYFFFEKLRILEKGKKTKKRLANEVDHPMGFSCETPRQARWFIVAR